MKNISKNHVLILLSIIVVFVSIAYLADYITNTPKVYSTENKEKANSTIRNIDTKDRTTKESESISKFNNSDEIEKSDIGNDIKVSSNLSSDDQVIEYFNIVDDKIDDMYENENKLRSEGKALFIKLIDFIYYDTEINGVKFNNLKETTKQTVINIANKIDEKIEKKVPGYKETVIDATGKTYSYATNKLKQGITYVDSKIDEKVTSDIYDNFKTDASNSVDTFKESFAEVKDTTKDVIASGKDKIKNWYESLK